jgi:hypothetical protein
MGRCTLAIAAGWLDAVAMTLDGNTIRCDAYGCRAVSFLEGAAAVAPEAVRSRFALHGWRSAGQDGDLDYCPIHD